MDSLLIAVKDGNGTCPVYWVCDSIVLDEGYRVNLKETDNFCMHSLSPIMPYYVALYRGVDSKELGLSEDGKKAYVQSLLPVIMQEEAQ